MPYIGNGVGNRFVSSKAASVYSGNGSTTAFTLEHAVGSDEDILVSVDGVIQEPSVAYAVSSGTTLTFTAAPSSNSGNNIFVYYLFRTVATVDHPSTSALSATSGTFSTDLTVSGAFTSQGIDDNADATAITIDSGESVFIGNTAEFIDGTGTGDKGIQLNPLGLVVSTRNGGISGVFGRQASDGTIVQFRKNGSEVGRIVYSNDTNIAFGNASRGVGIGSSSVFPTDGSTSVSNGGLSLGYGNGRWNNLYLSGNLYLGGTGSANAFDDYEEGTWTPQIYSNVTQIATSSVYGFYTKVGDLVHINGQVDRNDSASLSSTFLLKNLPFTSKSGTGCVYVNGGFWFDKASATDEVGFGYMSGGSTTVYVKTLNLSAAYITADALEHGRPVYFAFTYKTAT